MKKEEWALIKKYINLAIEVTLFQDRFGEARRELDSVEKQIGKILDK